MLNIFCIYFDMSVIGFYLTKKNVSQQPVVR